MIFRKNEILHFHTDWPKIFGNGQNNQLSFFGQNYVFVTWVEKKIKSDLSSKNFPITTPKCSRKQVLDGQNFFYPLKH